MLGLYFTFSHRTPPNPVRLLVSYTKTGSDELSKVSKITLSGEAEIRDQAV